MIEENELAKLEGFVSALLEKYNELQSNNKKLTERVERRDASIVSLKGEIALMKDERGEISSRVSGLIGQIEEWGSATADAEISTDGKSGGEADSDLESDDEKKESSVQGNLFNVEATNE